MVSFFIRHKLGIRSGLSHTCFSQKKTPDLSLPF